jgi:hypothetical protein
MLIGLRQLLFGHSGTENIRWCDVRHPDTLVVTLPSDRPHHTSETEFCGGVLPATLLQGQLYCQEQGLAESYQIIDIADKATPENEATASLGF